MSTNIPHGYRIENRSLFELKTMTDEFRSRIRGIAQAILCNRMGEICVSTIDHAHTGDIIPHADDFIGAKCESWPLISGAFEICRSRHLRVMATDHRDPDFDLECELVFLPLPEKVLCLLIAEQEEYRQAWRETPGVVSYAYQNSTDRPENIPEPEWDQRRDDWDAALSNRSASLSGMACKCIGKYFSAPAVEDVLKAIPTWDARLSGMAKVAVLDREMSKKRGELWRIDSTSAVMSSLREVGEWMKTEEGRVALSLEKERLAGILPGEITREMLFEKYEFYRELEPPSLLDNEGLSAGPVR